MKGRFRLFDSKETLVAGTGWKRQSHESLVLVLLGGLLLFAGCESGSFLPPRPADLRDEEGDVLAALPATDPSAAGLESVPTGAKSLELFMDRRNADEAEAVRAPARMQAGLDKVRLRTTVLSEQDLPARQAEQVREALSRQPRALIVEPADPTDRRLAEILEKAQADGVPVVLLNRPLAAGKLPSAPHPDSKSESPVPPRIAGAPEKAAQTSASQEPRPMVLVTPPPFEQSARQLVASAIRNAKNAKLDPKSGVVIMINAIGDPFLRHRTEALRTAIEDSGIKTIEEIPFCQDFLAGGKLLIKRLQANSKLTLVFSIDSLSSSAIRHAMTELGMQRPFILAGYSADELFADLPQVADFAAVATFAQPRLVRKAIDTAVALAEGKDVPSRIEVPIVFHDSPGNSGLPMSPAYRTKAEAPRTKAEAPRKDR